MKNKGRLHDFSIFKLPLYACVPMLIALSACSTPTDIKTKDPYYSTLATEYRVLAAQRRAAKDQDDYKHFSAKADKAAIGSAVPADSPHSRGLGQEKNPNLWTAWAQLDNMPSYIRSAFPRDTARAQVAYDCWLEERHRQGRRKTATACERQWTELSAQLECPMGCMDEAKNSLASFDIKFDTNSTTLSNAQSAILDEIAAYNKPGQYTLRITGHTDRSGSSAYNMKLAARRAESVAAALAQRGIPRQSLQIAAQGEFGQAITTDDDIKLDANRRVTIDVFEQN